MPSVSHAKVPMNIITITISKQTTTPSLLSKHHRCQASYDNRERAMERASKGDGRVSEGSVESWKRRWGGVGEEGTESSLRRRIQRSGPSVQ